MKSRMNRLLVASSLALCLGTISCSERRALTRQRQPQRNLSRSYTNSREIIKLDLPGEHAVTSCAKPGGDKRRPRCPLFEPARTADRKIGFRQSILLTLAVVERVSLSYRR